MESRIALFETFLISAIFNGSMFAKTKIFDLPSPRDLRGFEASLRPSWEADLDFSIPRGLGGMRSQPLDQDSPDSCA